MPRHSHCPPLILLLVAAPLLAPAAPAGAQVRYLAEEALGIGLMGEYGPHLGPQMTSAGLLLYPRGPFFLAFSAGTGRVATIPEFSGFADEQPRETYYGPRLGIRVSRRGSERAPQFWVTGGWEWQEITHPVITSADGHVRTSGPVLGVMLAQLMDRTDRRDVWFDGSLERYNLTVHIKNGEDYLDVWDPIITYQLGLTFAFKGGRTRPRSTLLRLFARVVEWDLTFGVGIGLLGEFSSRR